MGLKRWFEFYLGILFLCCTYQVVLTKLECTPGLRMPGYTIPQGDILIEYGKPLDITCVVVNNTYSNASLSFYRNNEPIPSEMIDVINSTTIKLHIEKPYLASDDVYNCLLNNVTSVCMNRVSVATPPQNVTDFKCISYNYDNLTCTWTAPQNYIRTDYNLSFTLGEGRTSRLHSPCPNMNTYKNPMSCFWNISTTPPYRSVHEFYNFALTMSNRFGVNKLKYIFNHYANVLSGPPENLSAINTTSSSVYLRWVIPLSMQTFPPGLQHRILYQCLYGEKRWIFGDLLSTKNEDIRNVQSEVFYNLTNLPYAYNLCDIRVALRSSKALNDESMWSQNATLNVRTSGRIPEIPPETNVGSFEIVASGNQLQYREVYIYWKQIPDFYRNGKDFQYNITVEGYESKKPVEVTNSYAKFKDLLISESYIFHIWSVNAEGFSLQKTSVFVPKQIDKVKDPISFTKVEISEGEFELTWEPPELAPNQYITNYTIFSCSNERDRPYQCNGYLNWTVVSNDTTTINVTVAKHKIFQFAISANTKNSSSGMLWAGCTIIQNKSMGKLKNVWINRVGSTFIEVGWKLDCADRIGSIEGYIVYYCPIISPRETGCKAPEANNTFHGTTITGGNITNLNPYTTYMLTVSAITKYTTFSQQSDPLYNTTLEAAPSSPLSLQASNITNTSIFIHWEPPQVINGVLKYYEVECTKNYDVIYNNKIEITQNNYTFNNLTSYENYTISVKACTVACSDEKNVTVSTKMGRASKISKPTVDRRNDTSITIIWNRPAKPGGKNDYYLVRLKKKYGNENKTSIYNTTAREYVFDNCGDEGKFNSFYISVKAVNKINGETVDGPWSDELENYCYTSLNLIMYIFLFIAVVVLVLVGFLFIRLYHRCKIMRDVEIKLPPGLAPVVADHTLVPWSTEKHQENRASHSPPDEELLLVKMSEGRHFSGDSSGCSSGHESVSSSLESGGTHMSSSSDSGTEQAQNYCALGVNPKVDSSYIPVTAEPNKLPFKSCDDTSESSPYVMTGEAVKTINPGYIPFNNTEPIEKSSGYVVAGIKNVNGYIAFNQTDPVSKNTGYVVAGIKNCKLD